MKLGIDRFLAEPKLRSRCQGRRVALLGHPASVTSDLTHSLDALVALKDLEVAAALGPQHGMRGEKQDNMIETVDTIDSRLGIPVFSLYGETRRPTAEMLASFDVLLVDLQDLGCRIYTFATTLLYVLEAAASSGQVVIVLDRPNPIGRPVGGLSLEAGHESFVGAAPFPMRHGMTLGELARWYVQNFSLAVDLQVVAMEGWNPGQAPGYGWPQNHLSWVNPSPNAANLSMARCYPGTVLLEGTTLSEGRGTTRPLEVVGAPDLNMPAVLAEMERLAPEWMQGCRLRPAFFEPTFHKYSGELCAALQIHVDGKAYDHQRFDPFKLIALAFISIRRLYPDYDLWRDFPYEYVTDRLAIDVIAGGPRLRLWVDDAEAAAGDLDGWLLADQRQWLDQSMAAKIYEVP
jgi:uncharacterized protein YbbC (DUF1343 family)